MATNKKLSAIVPEITSPTTGDRFYIVRGTTSYFIDSDNMPGSALEIGTNVQAYDADLTTIAALSPTKGNLLVGNGSAWIALGAGTDTHVLTFDSGEASGIKWAAASGGATLTIDTRANILATATPSSGDMYFASDTFEFFIYDGSFFKASPIEMETASTTPDMGLQPPNVYNDSAGYSETYITDKLIANSRIGDNANTDEGSIRTLNGTASVYLNAAWEDIVTNFRFREDSSGAYELEHRPIGFDNWYEIATGNSDLLAPNGRPIYQEYQTDMGAIQSALVVRSRTIS